MIKASYYVGTHAETYEFTLKVQIGDTTYTLKLPEGKVRALHGECAKYLSALENERLQKQFWEAIK